MPTILKNHYALYMEPFTTPSIDRFVTFYETIKVSRNSHYHYKHLPNASSYLLVLSIFNFGDAGRNEKTSHGKTIVVFRWGGPEHRGRL